VVLSRSSGRTGICQYLLLKSMVVNTVGIPERINALVHSWERIGVRNGYHIQSPVIHAKSQGPSGFGTKKIGEAP
jgi:hypothetical protein